MEGILSNVSTFAAEVDRGFWIHIYISLFVFLIVAVPMFYFAWKYNANRVKPENIENISHHVGLEMAWTIIPIILVLVQFWYGYTSFKELRTMPDEKDSVVVDLIGKKWSWAYTYANGKKTSELYVPRDKNVILKMTAPLDDVIHSYWVPAFRVKEDVIPGLETKMWFNANTNGSYDVECTEYCGTRHSYMLSKVHVIDPVEYNDWYSSDKRTPFETADTKLSAGQIAFEENGCNGCHSTDGSVLVGPSMKGLASKSDTYLKDALLNPDKDIAEGYSPGIMTSYEGVLSEQQTTDIVKYIKGL